MSAWQTNIEGSRPASGGAARAVAVDAAGNVVSAGGVPGSSESIFSVAKLAGSSGVVAWRYTASASSAFHVEAQMVGVDRAGNVLAAGFIASTHPNLQSILVKLDGADGSVIWTAALGLSADFDPQIRWMAVDPAGDILVDVNGSVVKVAGDSGARLWRLSRYDFGTEALALDDAGDVIVAGTAMQNTGRRDFAIMKLNAADGVELWRSTIPSGRATMVGVDSSGDVIAAGTAQVGTGARAIAVKLSGFDGAPTWRHDLSAEPLTLTVSPAGDPFLVVGIEVIKLAAESGHEQWRGSGNLDGHDIIVHEIRVDELGDVFAAGVTENTPDLCGVFRLDTQDPRPRTPSAATPGGFAVFALANADGRQRWSRRVGTADVGGQAFAVTLDVLGEVVAAGCTEDPGGGFTVVKLNGADGSSFDQCPGDCSADARVDINELVLGVGVTLGAVPVDACTAVDVNGDGWVTVEELVRAVRYALNGCPS